MTESFGIYSGVFLSLIVIFFDITIILLGLKKQDPLENVTYLKKVGLPASVAEIIYIIWAIYYLPFKLIFLIFLSSVASLVIKCLKIEGYKFILYVLAPLLEICIVIWGIIKILI